LSNDLALPVDRVGVTPPAKGSKVVHRARFPEESAASIVAFLAMVRRGERALSVYLGYVPVVSMCFPQC
jgi:hypothetical protein